MIFEKIGWSKLDYSKEAIHSIVLELQKNGFEIEKYSLNPLLHEFNQYLKNPEYASEYRFYGGIEKHCYIEKALEHFISLKIINPNSDMVGIDIGSCKSVVPKLLRRLYGCRIYQQDLDYPDGVHGYCIGSSADDIPLPNQSIDFMTLHCTFEHFEWGADTGFIKETARLLKTGGCVVILPLYLNKNFCNITGETNLKSRKKIEFDKEASFFCGIPEWKNRFGRHYSPAALLKRVIRPCLSLGLMVKLIHVESVDRINKNLWLKWILVLKK